MIDWDAIMERKPEKSALEKEFFAASQEYYDAFGENFPTQYPPADMRRDIAEMRNCIRMKKKREASSVNNEGASIPT